MVNFTAWFKQRGARFVLSRAMNLLARYDITPHKAITRIRSCVKQLQAYNCQPTFFVPAVVVQRNLGFIKELQDTGCEIGVHGYQHVDMRTIPVDKASQQLQRANECLTRNGIHPSGFRCPYLSYSSELENQLPAGLFTYSSNRSIMWPIMKTAGKENELLFETIRKFYNPATSKSSLSLPWKVNGMVEIPVCVPDDLQMRDGLNYSGEEITDFLMKTHTMIHNRGELFNIMFHPELASILVEPFLLLLAKINEVPGSVWIARLQEISAWWNEKERTRVDVEVSDGKYRLVFHSTSRCTLLARGLDQNSHTCAWDEKYQQVDPGLISTKFENIPLIGLNSGLPDWVKPALDQIGYIVVENDLSEKCSLLIDRSFTNNHNDPVALIEAIENSQVPLIRFWPWPDGYRSALCLTGDLDAVSLLDYATRLFPA